MASQRSVLVSFATALGVWAMAPASLGAERFSPPSRENPETVARCTVRRDGDGWTLVDPQAQPFFSLGVCCVHQGVTRAAFDPENPAYAAWQHYATPRQWAEASLERLRTWGFTTVGGWSDLETLRSAPSQTRWFTPVLHIGSTAGAPWWDMWDAKNLRRMEEVARREILAVRDDPRLLGYYSDNELGWWNATLWKMTLEQSATSGQRQRLIALLRQHYDQDWQKLARDFQAENATSWSELRRGGMLFLKPGGQGIRVLRQFLGLLADRYYQLMRDLIRKYDGRALFLGDRYQSFYYPEVARAAAPYVDAISSNLNASWSDGTFVRCYLDTLQALTGRPVLVTEYYAAAHENRSGNRNSHGVFPVVTTQAQRAATTRTTLEALLRLPYVIGADWFQYADEPARGRADGENFNFGLVDIHDQPYTEVVDTFATIDVAARRARTAPPRPNATQGVPRAPANPWADFEVTRALMAWDRERGFVPPVSEFPTADLYLGWSPQGLYLGLYALDVVESAYYRGGEIPKADRALWTVTVNRAEPVRARLGAGHDPLVSDPEVRVENLSSLDLNVRNIAIMELPARRWGVTALKPGDTMELSVTLLTHFQAGRLEWKGRFTLSD